ncbi:MAG: GTP cyclohydrolase I [Polyangiaceae bacterium]
MRAPDQQAAAQAVAAFLRALGYDGNEPDLQGTPERVAQAYASELLSGDYIDLGALLQQGSEAATDAHRGLVLVRDIDVVTVCPHHLLPAVGKATVAYHPGQRLLGLGTLARLAQACGRRLALQEAVGEQVVRALIDHAGARGAFCRLELLHTCLSARGAEQPNARLVTLARAGSLAEAQGGLELSLALSNEART